ncbi:uncharacterized protein LOC135849812 [Planococcus citri]|uniref:uncharacterized protein LOC135849812 n=1 Tax=Planococcus citri TaxID=170843 RepID=UPI0031F8B0B4
MSATSPLMVRKRGAKVNPKQKKILLQSMADNPLIYSRKITADFTIYHHKAFWRNMCAVLNVFGPPRKTVECWKKAWKDIRARYQKTGIDLKEIIINSSQCDHIVIDTKLLLDKADQISTLTKGKVDIEQALREAILSEGSGFTEFLLADMNVSNIKGRLSSHDNVSKIELDENRSVFNLVNENEEIESDDLRDLKSEKSDDDDLCEIAYEEVLEESDTDDVNYSDITTNHSGPSLKRKSDSKHNCFSSADESEEEEILKHNSVKKPKLPAQSSSSNMLPSSSNVSHKTESNNVQNSSSVLNDLLAELRQHNKIQSEKLAFDKTRFETKKRLREQSLVVKKDLAEANKLLAKSVKTFIDNISFNT